MRFIECFRRLGLKWAVTLSSVSYWKKNSYFGFITFAVCLKSRLNNRVSIHCLSHLFWTKKKGLHVISLIFLVALKNFSQMTNIFSSQMFHLLQKFKTHIFSLLSVCLLQNKVKTVAFCFWNLFVWKWTNFQHLFLFYEIFSFVLVLEFCLCFASTNVRICLLLILLLWLLENWRKHNHIFPRLTILISAGRNSRCLLYWIANFFQCKNNRGVLLKNSLVCCLLIISYII